MGEQRAADEEERAGRVEQDRPQERVPAEHTVRRRLAAVCGSKPGNVDRRQQNGDDRGGSCDDERAEQHVTSPPGQ